MLEQQTIQNILGIRGKIYTTKEDMVSEFKVTFSPYSKKASDNVREFEQKLLESFKRIGVEIIPYDDAWIVVPLKNRINRFFKYTFNNIIWIVRKVLLMSEVNLFIPLKTICVLASKKRIKKGICVICSGEQELKRLQMQYIKNFKDNSIITIVDFPENISNKSSFGEHFDTAMKLFAYHMTNIILAVDYEKMMVYNFNASHPIYSLNDNNFDNHILETLIPKIVAPISPRRFEEFNIVESRFDPEDGLHNEVIADMQEGAKMFSNTNLYPAGKKIDELPFRHNFHSLIGRLHLDNRNGMSFGFLSHQMPFELADINTLNDFKFKYKNSFSESDFFINEDGDRYILLNIENQELVVRVPDVWVMTLRSGSDKTHFNPSKDLIKLGLIRGVMQMQFPKGLKISSDYKPSFDTEVILSHAVGNVIVASILEYLKKGNQFSKNSIKNGLSISHWHGYFNRDFIPNGMIMYGADNPHVSCSSPQSAIYAFSGKLSSFVEYIKSKNVVEYRGDIHIEPHHGVNVIFSSLTELADYILKNPESTQLGNKYLNN